MTIRKAFGMCLPFAVLLALSVSCCAFGQGYVIGTLAGNGILGFSGDGGPASSAGVHGARAVKVAADGTVYILERQGSTLRAVDPRSGIIKTLAGTGARGYGGCGVRTEAFARHGVGECAPVGPGDRPGYVRVKV